jgi:hypothetical protein
MILFANTKGFKRKSFVEAINTLLKFEWNVKWRIKQFKLNESNISGFNTDDVVSPLDRRSDRQH